MSRINVAVIGCGHWGPNFIRNFSRIHNVNVKYACDLSPQRLRRIKNAYPSVKTVKDCLTPINDSDVDAIVISTPAETHYSIAKNALKGEKHVLLEKPIATNLREGRDLVSIARRKRKILMVSHTFKFNPGIQELKRIIKKGTLGEIYYINSLRTNLGPLRKDVNVMWDLAPHDLSIISYLLDSQPISVSAIGKKFLPHNLEDIVFITMAYPRNIFAHIHVSWLDPRKTREITIVGKRKMVVFDDLDSVNPVKVYDKSVIKKYFKQDYNSFEKFKMIIKSGKVSIPGIEQKEPLYVECSHFIECIRKEKKPITDGSEGCSVLRTLCALDKSLTNSGRLIRVK
jgi:predicted dehydrogenase